MTQSDITVKRFTGIWKSVHKKNVLLKGFNVKQANMSSSTWHKQTIKLITKETAHELVKLRAIICRLTRMDIEGDRMIRDL